MFHLNGEGEGHLPSHLPPSGEEKVTIFLVGHPEHVPDLDPSQVPAELLPEAKGSGGKLVSLLMEPGGLWDPENEEMKNSVPSLETGRKQEPYFVAN